MDGLGPINSSRQFNNKNLVDMLLGKPKPGGRNLGAGRKESRSVAAEMTFEERMSEIKEMMEVPAASGTSQTPAASSSSEPSEGAAHLTSGDSQLADRQAGSSIASMLQKRSRSAAGSVSVISVDISITEISIVSAGGEPPEPQQTTADPLVLDLDRDGTISIAGPDPESRFDINGDGCVEQTAFVSGGDGALALDRDGDGKITSGLELFGDQHGSANGFLELGKFDDNHDGIIDKTDAVFSELSVVSRGTDGTLLSKSLARYGIAQLDLGQTRAYVPLEGGSYISEVGRAVDTEGRKVLLADANFAYVA